MSPIDRIPPELLCQILSATFPADEDPEVSPSTGPFLLTQVCQKWRHVAIHDPRLWSSFKVTISPSTPPTLTHAVRLFLERSASQNLSISVVADAFKQLGPDARKLATSIIHLLAKHAARWARVLLILPASSALFAALCTFPAPTLTRLSLLLGNWTYEDASNINNLLIRAPALREFSWTNRASWGSWDVPFDTGLEQLRAPWHALTDIQLDTYVTLKVALAILRQCHLVVSLGLPHFSCGSEQLIATVSSEDDPLTAHIHLPHLQSLRVFQNTLDDGLGSLLESLVCPQLRHFSFTSGFLEQVKWPQTSFYSFLNRSSCHLESLVLESPGITEDQLIQCLQYNSSTLTSLEVYNYQSQACVGDHLLAMLLCRTSVFGNCATLCPKLGTLTLDRVTECTNGALAAVLRSRTPHSIEKHACGTCRPLQQVDIHFQKKYHESNVSDLDYLR